MRQFAKELVALVDFTKARTRARASERSRNSVSTPNSSVQQFNALRRALGRFHYGGDQVEHFRAKPPYVPSTEHEMELALLCGEFAILKLFGKKKPKGSYLKHTEQMIFTI